MKQLTGQNRAILLFLESGGSLSTMDALEKFGSFRLSARIKNLRDLGYNIQTDWFTTPNGKKVSRYYIPKKFKNKENYSNDARIRFSRKRNSNH